MGLLDDLFGKETIAQLQVLAKKREAEVAQLKSSVMGLENLNSKHVGDLRAVKDQLEQKVQQLKQIEEEKIQLANLKAELEQRMASSEFQSSENSQALEHKVVELQQTVDDQKQLIATLQAENANAKKILERTSDLDEREQKLSASEKRLAQDFDALVLEQKIFESRDADLQARELNWTQQIEPKFRDYEKHQSLDEREKQLTLFHEKLHKLNQLLQEQEADMVARKNDAESLRLRAIELNDREFRLSGLEQGLKKSKTDIDRQIKDADARTKKLEDWARDLAKFQSQVNAIDEDRERLKDLQAELDQVKKNNIASYKQQEAEIKAQRLELKQLSNVLTEQELNLEKREKICEGFETKNAKLKSQYLELNKQHRELMAINLANEQRLVSVESDHKKLLVKYNALTASHASLSKGRLAAKAESSSSLLHPKIFAWLIEDANPDEAGVDNGYLGTNGTAPWDESEFDDALKEQGFGLYTMPDPDLEHIIVGRKNWSKKDLLAQIDARDGMPLRIYSQEMFFAKLVTGKDPFDAEDLDLLEAFAEDHPALQFLMSLPEPWPEVTLDETSLVTVVGPHDYGVKESPLHLFGYKVGMRAGFSATYRRKILAAFLEADDLVFSEESDEDYKAKWGRPGKAQRLYRMAAHIKYLIESGFGQGQKMHQARTDWSNDLSWLEKTYFHKFKNRFSWPGV